MNTTVYIAGIVLQGVAGLIALLQVRRAPRKLPWLLIAVSSLLIVGRRSATLGQFMGTSRELAAAEVLTLVVSALFFMGVLLMSRMFGQWADAHEALRRSEALLSQSQEIALMGSWSRDAATNLLTWSDETFRIFGLTPRGSAPDYEEFLGAVHPDDRAMVDAACSESLRDNKAGYEIEYRIMRQDTKEVRYIFEKCINEHNGAGRTGRSVGVLQDITERKRTEEALKASLKEKEVLLKEIHHRVKNNLAVIAAILKLQSSSLDSREARQALEECNQRVHTMAMIHTKLYQSKDLARIDFAAYLRELVDVLSLSYVLSPDTSVRVRADEVYLDIDTAVPLSLIINELVTNALKYAFPPGRNGEIRVGLGREGKALTLTVSDNGVGFPEGLGFRETDSLGMQLVTALVEQLDGTIELKREGGTEFRISLVPGK